MAKADDEFIGKLTALEVKAFAKERSDKTQALHDGRGLYFVRDKRGASCNWVFRYTRLGKAHTLCIGAWPDWGLQDARKQHVAYRRTLKVEGKDPLTAKRMKASAAGVTVKDVAEAWMASHRSGWTAKYNDDVKVSLETWVFPVIGKLSIADVDVHQVELVLKQDTKGKGKRPKNGGGRFWDTYTVTAGRVRQRLESVLAYAATKGQRSRESNPATMVKTLFPAKAKVHAVTEHPSLPYACMAEFMGKLRATEGVIARALEWTVLTNPRSGSTYGATWAQVDLEGKVWTIPSVKAKGKAKREHRIPLSQSAAALLTALKPEGAKPEDLIFQARGKALGANNMIRLLREIVDPVKTFRDRDGRVPDMHGFRASFRTWGQWAWPNSRDALEECMAHEERSATVAAYARNDLLEARRPIMDSWANYCAGASGAGLSDLEEARRAAMA